MDADQSTPELAQDAPRHSMQRLVHPLSDDERAANLKSIRQMHRGNRFRLMLGMPLLPEEKKLKP